MSKSTTSTPPPTITHPAHTLLARSHDLSTAASIFTDKIKNKPLLLSSSNNGTTRSTSHHPIDSRAKRRKIRLHKQRYHLSHAKTQPLSAKEKRTLGLHDLRPDEIKYSIYKRLNGLWRGYFFEVLNISPPSSDPGVGLEERTRTGGSKDNNKIVNNSSGSGGGNGTRNGDGSRNSKQNANPHKADVDINPSAHGSLLASLDYHGMEVLIVKARDVSLVGLKGIVVRETKSTFVIVTPSDTLRTVVKKGAVFRVVVDISSPLSSPSEMMGHARPTENIVSDNVESEVRPESIVEHGGEPRRIQFDIHGSRIDVRLVLRAVKKFKWDPALFKEYS